MSLPSSVGVGLTGEAAGSGPMLAVCLWEVCPWEACPVHPLRWGGSSSEGGTGLAPVHSPGRQLVQGDLLPGGNSTSLPLCPGPGPRLPEGPKPPLMKANGTTGCLGPGSRWAEARLPMNAKARLLWVTQPVVAPKQGQVVGGGQATSLCSSFWLFQEVTKLLNLPQFGCRSITPPQLIKPQNENVLLQFLLSPTSHTESCGTQAPEPWGGAMPPCRPLPPPGGHRVSGGGAWGPGLWADLGAASSCVPGPCLPESLLRGALRPSSPFPGPCLVLSGA